MKGKRMPRARERGFSLAEVLVSVSVLAVTFVSLGGAVMTGVRSTVQQKEKDIVRNQALRYMERLQKLSFGDASDTAPSADDLSALFDDSTQIPDITLSQVRTPVDEDGRKFRLAGFEVPGIWEVRVDADANGNGVEDGDEAAKDLLRIQVLFRGKPILTTFRSRPSEVN